MIQKRQLQFQLLQHATNGAFIESLNGDDASLSPKSRGRLTELLELIQRAESQAMPECDEMMDEINEKLLRYRWSPMLERLDSPRGFKVSHLPDGASMEEDYEIWCVWWITELIRQRSIWRVRRCVECGRWFWAVREHQRHCSGSCRKAHATHSPLFKEKRRLYMIDYRQKERDEGERLRQLAAKVKGR